MAKIKISERQRALVERVKLLKDKKSLSGAELARITGRSEGTISDLLGGKKAFSDKLLGLMYKQLRDYMGEDNLVKTRQYERMWRIAETGKAQSDMRLVVGNSGIGKTVVFKKFAEENTHCCYYKIFNRNITWNRFLFEISRGFGIKLAGSKKRYSTNELMSAICAWVEQHADDNPMLILDESEVFRNSFFKELKNLRTATEDLLAIVIVGITELVPRIAKLSGLDPETWFHIREDSNQYTTFARRIKTFRIPNISTDDLSLFCADRGISNQHVVAAASKRWWNYDEAERSISKLEAMGIDLQNITIEQFMLLYQ